MLIEEIALMLKGNCAIFIDQYYVNNFKTLWHTATYVYNCPLRCTLQHLADDIENS